MRNRFKGRTSVAAYSQFFWVWAFLAHPYPKFVQGDVDRLESLAKLYAEPFHGFKATGSKSRELLV
jgi:hypothetical protein